MQRSRSWAFGYAIFSFLPWSGHCWAQERESAIEASKGLQFSQMCFSVDGGTVFAIVQENSQAVSILVFDRVKKSKSELPNMCSQFPHELAVSPDGKWLLAGGPCCIARWKLPSLNKDLVEGGCPRDNEFFVIDSFVTPQKRDVVAYIHQIAELNSDKSTTFKTKLTAWDLEKSKKTDLLVVSSKHQKDVFAFTPLFSDSGKYLACHNHHNEVTRFFEMSNDQEFKDKFDTKTSLSRFIGFSKKDEFLWFVNEAGDLVAFNMNSKTEKKINVFDRDKRIGGGFTTSGDRILVNTKRGDEYYLELVSPQENKVLKTAKLARPYSSITVSLDRKMMGGCASGGGLFVWSIEEWAAAASMP